MKSKTLFLAATVALILSGCSDRERGSALASDKAKREQAKIVELASRYNAYVDWWKSVPVRGLYDVFTVDVKKALVRTNEQQVALAVRLEDVSEKDGVFTGHFTANISQALESGDNSRFRELELNLSLRCSAQQAEDLLKAKADSFHEIHFVIVTAIDSVSRHASGAYSSAYTQRFDANGALVDLVYLE